MATKGTALLMVWLAAVVTVGWSWREEAAAMVGDKDDSWVDRALNKLSEGFGLNSDNAKDAAQKLTLKAKVAASKSTDTLNSAAYETSKYASEMANEVADKTYEKLGDGKRYASAKMKSMAYGAEQVRKDKAKDAYKSISEKADKAKDKAYDAYSFASDMAGDAKDIIKDKANDVYDLASRKVHYPKKVASDMGDVDAYDNAARAKNGASDMAKDKENGAYDFVSDKGDEIIRMATDKDGDAEDKMANAMSYAKHKAFDKFDDAKLKVHDTFMWAKESMSDRAAKEK